MAAAQARVLTLTPVASLMVALDVLAVSTALSTIRAHLHAGEPKGGRGDRGGRAQGLPGRHPDQADQLPHRVGQHVVLLARGDPGLGGPVLIYRLNVPPQ
jgi:hypothetical protein